MIIKAIRLLITLYIRKIFSKKKKTPLPVFRHVDRFIQYGRTIDVYCDDEKGTYIYSQNGIMRRSVIYAKNDDTAITQVVCTVIKIRMANDAVLAWIDAEDKLKQYYNNNLNPI